MNIVLRRVLRLTAGVLASLIVFAASGGTAFAANDPSGVSFTLEGCRNDGTITLPNGSGKFICPDAAYTTGNLGKGWDELDLVPHRVTARAGNSAPTTQTYTIALAADNCDGTTGTSYTCADSSTRTPGYDVMSAPVLNTALSSASCSASVVGSQTPVAPGVGGTAVSIARLLTISQAKNTTCVYDYYERLALGSHLFPGASLHSDLLNQQLGTQGVGAKDVSIPVNQISPQALNKDMTATEGSDHTWEITKSATPESLSFGDVCAADAPTTKSVSFTVTWTKHAAVGSGTVTVITHVYATNPASRSITTSVTDVIYSGTTALDTASAGPIDVPANTTNFLVLTHQTTVPDTAANLNDIATGTYSDAVTGIPIPGTTTATASAAVQFTGPETNASATIIDIESMTGSGLTFSVAQPAFGSFFADPGPPITAAYVVPDQTVGPVDWSSGTQTDSGSITFSKTVYLDQVRVTSGTLSDTAALSGSDGFTASAGPVNIGVSSQASTKLTISKTIPAIRNTGEKFEVTFHITRANDANFSQDYTFVFDDSHPNTTQTHDFTGLVPDQYTVAESGNVFYPVSGPSVPNLLQAQGSDSQTVDLSQDPDTGVVAHCSGTATFTNILQSGPARAQVQKTTSPSSDTTSTWTFTLTGPGTPPAGIAKQATAQGPAVDFGIDLQEGNYTVTETPQTGWDLSSAVPPGGTATACTFTVDYPEDEGRTFTCTFNNVKRGLAQVVKTVSGAALTGTQSFTFQLRSGASASAAGTVLETGTANATSSTISFSTLLVPGQTYQVCEVMNAGWLTTLGPPLYSVFNPSGDNSTVCTDFTVQAGETKVFTIDNRPPPGGMALTIGYWKNWASCTKSNGNQAPKLDQALALGDILIGKLTLHDSSGVPASDCLIAVRLLSKQDIVSGASKSSDPAFNLAAQLLAADLNVASGAGTCAASTAAITQAQQLLFGVNFNGTGSYPTKGTFATNANSTAATLDKYNNNKLCI